MTILEEAVNTPIATAELERRWALIRKAMDASRIDVLIMHNNNDYLGGYVKYFTDVPAMNGYPVTVIFPHQDLMTLIQHGPTGVVEQLPPNGDGLIRGVKTVMYCASFAPVGYSLAYDAAATMKALEPYAGGVIGMVGLGTLPVSIIDHVRSGKLANTTFVDATDLVEAIKVIKSPVEIELIRRTARLQDRAMQAAFATIKPGMRERDVVAVAEPIITRGGGEQALYLACSVPSNGPAGQARPPASKHLQNRILGEGDVFFMLVESNGPGGMFTELSRTCVLGKAPHELKDECTLIREARRHTLEMLKPGSLLQGDMGRAERMAAQSWPAGRDSALLPRPGLRFGRAAASQVRRILYYPGEHEHYLSPELDNEPLLPRSHGQLPDWTDGSDGASALLPGSDHGDLLNESYSPTVNSDFRQG